MKMPKDLKTQAFQMDFSRKQQSTIKILFILKWVSKIK